MKSKGWAIFFIVLFASIIGEIYFRTTWYIVGAVAGVACVIALLLYHVFADKFIQPKPPHKIEE